MQAVIDEVCKAADALEEPRRFFMSFVRRCPVCRSRAVQKESKRHYACSDCGHLFAGVRIGIAVTLLGILIGELFASSSGIGYALIRATERHNVVDIFALTLLLFLFAVAINTLLHAGERRVSHHA